MIVRRSVMLVLQLFFSAFMLAGCGGDGATVAPAPATVSGIAADGYLQGATVCLDLNNNGRCDSGEPSATTGSGGAFTLEVGSFDADAYPVVVEVAAGTVDEDAGPVAKGYTLRSPAGKYSFVSPLTTLVQAKIDQNPALDSNAAAQIVGLQLNVEDPSKIYSDFINDAGQDSELEGLHKSAQAVARAFGDVGEILDSLKESLEDTHELRAVQVMTGNLLLSRLDQVAVAVGEGGDAFDPDAAAAGLNVGSEAGGIAAENIGIVAQQIAAADSSGRTAAGSILPGKTLYNFQEDGTRGAHTLIEIERFSYGQTSVATMDAYDDEIVSLEELDGQEGEIPSAFTLDGDGNIIFSADVAITETHLTTTAEIDLQGLTFKLGELALTKMQDADLRDREVVFAAGDLMYKVKAVYFATDVEKAAKELDEEMRTEEAGYENGNSVDDLKNYAQTRNIGFPIDDHGVILGSKTYLKYFQPSADGMSGILKAVNQSDGSDAITVGNYRILELENLRAVIVMDLLGFAEVNKVWDHILIVNDARNNHDFDEVLIADTVGSKSAEVFYFNRSAMEKIYTVIKDNNLP